VTTKCQQHGQDHNKIEHRPGSYLESLSARLVIAVSQDSSALPRRESPRSMTRALVFKSGSNIASHAWLEGHPINFENARVVDRGNSRVRKTLES